MKSLILFCFASLLALTLCFCTSQNVKQDDSLTPAQVSSIESEIIKATDDWGNASKSLDINGSAALWLNSKDFRLAENGVYFASYDSLFAFLGKSFATSDSLSFNWIKREVFPLTPGIACFAGSFNFSLHFKDGSKWKGTNALTATFIRKDGSWKVINGHESTKLE
jgi:hypothetical protein